MGYSLLGRAVWFGATWFLRRKYGQTPRKVGAVLLVAGAVCATLPAQLRLVTRKKGSPGHNIEEGPLITPAQ